MGLVAIIMDRAVLEDSLEYMSHWEAQTLSNHLLKP